MDTPETNNTQTVETAFRFSEDVHSSWDEEIGKTWDLLSSLSDAVLKESIRWKDKLPYHINLLDILCPGETDHSKILRQLLRFKTPEGNYEILKSLIAFIQETTGKFNGIAISKPEISTETGHIDLWIRERGRYALIFENKSNWAGDQPNQLARYIRTVGEHGYSEQQIYVLYLPPDASKQPEDQAWFARDTHSSLKEEFEARYVSFSFREGVLPWLKEHVLPHVRNKDAHLSSAVAQYIDHWEGRSGLRASEKGKNMSIENIVKQKLCISSEPTKFLDELKALKQKSAEFSALMGHLSNIEKTLLIAHAIPLQMLFWADLAGQLRQKGYEISVQTPDADLSRQVDEYYRKDNDTWPGFQFPFYTSDSTSKTYQFRIEIGKDWYYGFRKLRHKAKDDIMEACVRDRRGQANDWWFKYTHPTPQYALNFRTFDSPGFSNLMDPNKREVFMSGLAEEIHAYIQDFLRIAKERGL